MATGAIGTLALKISADGADLEKALDRAQGKVANFAKGMAKPFEALQGNIKLITSSISGLLGPAGSLIAGGGLAGAIFNVTDPSKAVERYEALLEKVVHTARESKKLDIDPQFLKALQFAGGDADSVNMMLERYNRLIGEAASGSDEARGKFRRFGFDWQEMAKKGTEGVYELADAYKKLDAASKQLFSREYFGRGADAEKLLGGGSARLKGFFAKIKGLDIDSPELIREAMADALQKKDYAIREEAATQRAAKFIRPGYQRAWDAASWNRAFSGDPEAIAGIAALPPEFFLQQLDTFVNRPINAINELVQPTQGVREKTTLTTAEKEKRAKARTDSLAKLAQADLQQKAADLGASMYFDVDSSGPGGKFAKQIEGLKKSGLTAEDLDALGQGAKYNATQGANNKLREMADAAGDVVKAFGQPFNNPALEKLLREGADPAAVDRVKDIGKSLAGLQEKQQAEGPLGAFNREQARLDELLAGGKIDQATRDAGVGRAFLPLAQSLGMNQLTGAAEAGTTAGYSAVAQGLAGGGAVDVKATLDAQKMIQEQSRDYLQQIAQQLKGGGQLPASFFDMPLF